MEWFGNIAKTLIGFISQLFSAFTNPSDTASEPPQPAANTPAPPKANTPEKDVQQSAKQTTKAVEKPFTLLPEISDMLVRQTFKWEGGYVGPEFDGLHTFAGVQNQTLTNYYPDRFPVLLY